MQPGDPIDVTTRPSEPPDAVLRYAAHADGVVDVHLPPSLAFSPGPRPLVVFVHGGFWRQAYDRRHARPLANALAAQGYAVAVPEYRRGAGAWRETFTDLRTVLDGLPDLLGRVGLVTTTTTLVGHSAGGHLVLWLANEGYAVQRVVALAPVGDLRYAADTGMGDHAVRDFLGGSAHEVLAAYDAADPASRMRTRPPADVVVVHGDRDDAVPIASSRGLAARFGWLGLRELPGHDHLDLIDPLSAAWPTVLDAVRSGTLEA